MALQRSILCISTPTFHRFSSFHFTNIPIYCFYWSENQFQPIQSIIPFNSNPLTVDLTKKHYRWLSSDEMDKTKLFIADMVITAQWTHSIFHANKSGKTDIHNTEIYFDFFIHKIFLLVVSKKRKTSKLNVKHAFFCSGEACVFDVVLSFKWEFLFTCWFWSEPEDLVESQYTKIALNKRQQGI